jgi:sRNA-binding regulator protein Hfq
MSANLIDNNLKIAVEQSKPVKMTLRDGSVVSLKVKEFDGYVVLVEGKPDYLLYRHSILDIDAGLTHGPRRDARQVSKKDAAPPRPSAKPRQPGKPRSEPADKKRRPRREAGDQNRQPLRQDPVRTDENAFGNSLADKLKAWQDSSKEGE